jgi:hypothetical protein
MPPRLFRPASGAALALELALVAAATAALAPAHASPPRPDPLDASATVPTLTHRSPLQSHRRLPEVPPPEGARWREGNETVNRIGGWRAYARESAAAAAAAAAAATAASAPAGGRR